jgi:hypothetical protein
LATNLSAEIYRNRVPFQGFKTMFSNNSVSYELSKWFSKVLYNFNWILEHMDLTQWGIVSVVFVVLGFLALKTRF